MGFIPRDDGGSKKDDTLRPNLDLFLTVQYNKKSFVLSLNVVL
jgi:hypothetical protein